MTEKKRNYRTFTTEEKITILAEAEQPGVTVSAVCRKNQIAPTQFYRWRAVAQAGASKALKADKRGKAALNKDQEQARLEAELNRLRAVISEITAEN
jgi:transposase